ncbi:MAG: hypothetical protein HC824_11450 [Synechococcales cyanobacterium RM1_1_8]|nr:hypothetical protein [Synechococcales cyanobacterium RM1_1_8]
MVGLWQLPLRPPTPSTLASSSPGRLEPSSANRPAVSNPGCAIKGNISFSSGKKFYHLPGMRDYEITLISPEKGERWFCSEQEAIAAGWQKAPNPRSAQ